MDTIQMKWSDKKGCVELIIKDSNNKIIYSGIMTAYDFGKSISSNDPGYIERLVDNTKFLLNNKE